MKNAIISLIFSLALLICKAGDIVELNRNWQFRELNTGAWMPATVPGTVHTDLMKSKKIPDPYYRDNEKKVQWVGERTWEYRTTFSMPAKGLKEPLTLRFEGLDTYADIYLNGTLLQQTDNMFRTYAIDAKNFIKPGNNVLRIVFHPAEKVADSLAAQALPLVRPSENNRHYTRKAQYHFGWDWGPKLVTCGIWRRVSLIVGTQKPGREILPDNNIRLVREKDSIGESFYFTVEGKPTYMRGANWIPADMFQPRITKDHYRKLLVAAKKANMNMLRVWGGGVYESDEFYTLCDSLGIWVWQDFMFAGAMYPGDDKFIENVRQEAIDNVRRLRQYKCIVLWCGNNEIDEAWNNWGWKGSFSRPEDSVRIWNEYKRLFHEVLPEVVKEYGNGVQYISTTPMYGWGRSESMTHGDSHYWGLWHGVKPIDTMRVKVPRFMSEFGMQSMPEMSTIRRFALPSDMDTSSAVMKTHQKHRTGYENLAAYLQMENLHPKNFAEYVEATQELQSRALKVSLEAQMFSKGRCMGSLIWQLNDCWPVASWSLIDYYFKPKKAYGTVKEIFAKKADGEKAP